MRSKQKTKGDINNNNLNETKTQTKNEKKSTKKSNVVIQSQLSVNSSPSSCTASSFSSSSLSNSSADSTQILASFQHQNSMGLNEHQQNQFSNLNIQYHQINERQFELNNESKTSLAYTPLLISPNPVSINNNINIQNSASTTRANLSNSETNLIQFYNQNLSSEQTQSPMQNEKHNHSHMSNHHSSYNNSEEGISHHMHHQQQHPSKRSKHDNLENEPIHHLSNSKQYLSNNQSNNCGSILQYQLSKPIASSSNQLVQHHQTILMPQNAGLSAFILSNGDVTNPFNETNTNENLIQSNQLSSSQPYLQSHIQLAIGEQSLNLIGNSAHGDSNYNFNILEPSSNLSNSVIFVVNKNYSNNCSVHQNDFVTKRVYAHF